MGVQLWAQGNTDPKVYQMVGDGRLHVTYQGRLVRVLRSEVGQWVDDWFWSVLDLWWRWKTFGALPFSGGWAEQPAHMIEAIETAEAAYKETQRHDR